MPNTDTKVNYSLRQQKSIERRMLCQLFSIVNRVFDIKDYWYVGMGGKFFADYVLFHRELGFFKMISIEANTSDIDKYEFNKPLKCITIEPGYSYDVLTCLNWKRAPRSIIWLDYDGILSSYMLEDLKTIISKIKSGSMFFISFNPHVGIDTNERLNEYQKNLGDYYPSNCELKTCQARKNTKLTVALFTM